MNVFSCGHVHIRRNRSILVKSEVKGAGLSTEERPVKPQLEAKPKEGKYRPPYLGMGYKTVPLYCVRISYCVRFI